MVMIIVLNFRTYLVFLAFLIRIDWTLPLIIRSRRSLNNEIVRFGLKPTVQTVVL
jgi:hypothetical protein